MIKIQVNGLKHTGSWLTGVPEAEFTSHEILTGFGTCLFRP